MNSKQKVAVTEFVGKFPGRHAHENVKEQNDESVLKDFPKIFQAHMAVQNDDYPLYQRSDNGRTTTNESNHDEVKMYLDAK